jgi:hypothetical protein
VGLTIFYRIFHIFIMYIQKFHRKLSVPHNLVMDLNNVMDMWFDVTVFMVSDTKGSPKSFFDIRYVINLGGGGHSLNPTLF